VSLPAGIPLAEMDADVVTSVVIFALTAAATWIGYVPMRQFIVSQERLYDAVLRGRLLLDVRPRTVTVMAAMGIVFLGGIGYLISRSVIGFFLAGAVGVFLPTALLKYLRKRRLNRLEEQLVPGIQTLCSGVRAGLNLVQAIELVARDGPAPLKQEFGHLFREYEYGIPLEEAMASAALRIGSGDFRLLFSALQMHRERGGDLGETLDRIADSIREIQRLEGRIKTLTAQGRANARMLAILVGVVLFVLYLIDPSGVKGLCADDLGKVILAVIAVLNVISFLWIKKIVAIDI
jgi:tight adherence protein B